MNKVEAIKRLNESELKLGIAGTSASWHAKYAETDAIYVGGIPPVLTEGDLLSIFEQYGIIVHVNLIRDSESGKSRGFAFLRYHDPRSALLAVDNFNGASILEKTIRVDHAENYKTRESEGNEALDSTPPALLAAARKGHSTSVQDNRIEENGRSSAKNIDYQDREERIFKRLREMREGRKVDPQQKGDNREKRVHAEQQDDSHGENRVNGDNSNGRGEEQRNRAEKERQRREKEERRAQRAQIREERKIRRAKRSEAT